MSGFFLCEKCQECLYSDVSDFFRLLWQNLGILNYTKELATFVLLMTLFCLTWAFFIMCPPAGAVVGVTSILLIMYFIVYGVFPIRNRNKRDYKVIDNWPKIENNKDRIKDYNCLGWVASPYQNTPKYQIPPLYWNYYLMGMTLSNPGFDYLAQYTDLEKVFCEEPWREVLQEFTEKKVTPNTDLGELPPGIHTRIVVYKTLVGAWHFAIQQRGLYEDQWTAKSGDGHLNQFPNAFLEERFLGQRAALVLSCEKNPRLSEKTISNLAADMKQASARYRLGPFVDINPLVCPK